MKDLAQLQRAERTLESDIDSTLLNVDLQIVP
jgi:hypothetical protein